MSIKLKQIFRRMPSLKIDNNQNILKKLIYHFVVTLALFSKSHSKSYKHAIYIWNNIHSIAQVDKISSVIKIRF